jgi:MFS family permease
MMLLSNGGWVSNLWTFITAGVVIGLGLSSLLGAPVRYIMLNESSLSDRASAQGAIALFTSVGQLTSSALVGAVAASMGGGVRGYGTAYLVIGVIAAIMVFLTFGLKNRGQEQATLQRTESAPATN